MADKLTAPNIVARVQPDLARKARLLAVAKGMTLAQVIDDILDEYMTTNKSEIRTLLKELLE